MNTSKLDVDPMVELTLQALTMLVENPDPGRPLVRGLDADPILDRAIDEALNFLEAAAHED